MEEQRVFPEEFARHWVPPWGGDVDGHKPICTRRTQQGKPCRRQAAEWPAGYVRYPNPVACWHHLNDAERAWSLEARELYYKAFYEWRERHSKA